MAAIIRILQEWSSQTVGEIIVECLPERRSLIVRGLVWLAKVEAIYFEEPLIKCSERAKFVPGSAPVRRYSEHRRSKVGVRSNLIRGS